MLYCKLSSERVIRPLGGVVAADEPRPFSPQWRWRKLNTFALPEYKVRSGSEFFCSEGFRNLLYQSNVLLLEMLR
jgi:hypothetical protein